MMEGEFLVFVWGDGCRLMMKLGLFNEHEHTMVERQIGTSHF